MTNNGPVRVLMIAGTLTPGGAEKQLDYHVRSLVGAGAEVILVSLDGEGYYGPRLEDIVTELVHVDESGGRLGRLARLAAMARRFAPDFVQATHTFVNLYAFAAGKACGAISIGALRANLSTTSASNRRLTRWQLRAPDAIVANSERAAQDLTQGLIRTGGIHVLGNVVDLETMDREMEPRQTLRAMVSADAEDVVVLGLGTVNDDKAFDRFLRVIERARSIVPAIKGVIVGDGPRLQSIQAMRERSAILRDGVTFAGRHAGGFRLMHGADVFMLSSENEGMPNALLESLAARLPAVVTRAGDAGLLVERAGCGFVRARDDEEGLADSVVELARSATSRRKYGERGRAYAERELDVRLLWPRLRDLYAALADRKGDAALTRRIRASGPPALPDSAPGPTPLTATSDESLASAPARHGGD